MAPLRQTDWTTERLELSAEYQPAPRSLKCPTEASLMLEREILGSSSEYHQASRGLKRPKGERERQLSSQYDLA